MLMTPSQVVAQAKARGCRSISYTYTEPTVFYEFMLDCARLAHQEGIRNVWVTCGYINPAPLRELCKVLDAANIDVKGFDEAFYRRYCGGSLEPVLTALQIAHEEKVWVEVTNLIVPGGNDDPRMIADLCKWHMAHLGADVPLHFSRFSPMYQMQDAPFTPLETLLSAARTAREAGIRYVYVGNIATPQGEDTLCPKCGRALVRRQGFIVSSNEIRDGRCPFCGAAIAGVWSAK
jgi:pyruvate formate lyase activating enzyme